MTVRNFLPIILISNMYIPIFVFLQIYKQYWHFNKLNLMNLASAPEKTSEIKGTDIIIFLVQEFLVKKVNSQVRELYSYLKLFKTIHT